MKLTTQNRFWIVTNPTAKSIIEDILFQTNLYGLENQIVGARTTDYNLTDRDLTIYTDEGPARRDAEARLAARHNRS